MALETLGCSFELANAALPLLRNNTIELSHRFACFAFPSRGCFDRGPDFPFQPVDVDVLRGRLGAPRNLIPVDFPRPKDWLFHYGKRSQRLLCDSDVPFRSTNLFGDGSALRFLAPNHLARLTEGALIHPMRLIAEGKCFKDLVSCWHQHVEW